MMISTGEFRRTRVFARNGAGERVIVCRKTCGGMHGANNCGAQFSEAGSRLS